MSFGDVLELNDVLVDPSLMKNLLLVSCMEDHQRTVAFEGQHCTINDCSLASLGTLARGGLDGGLYAFLVDPIALAHSSRKLDEPSSFEEAYVEHPWHNAMRQVQNLLWNQ